MNNELSQRYFDLKSEKNHVDLILAKYGSNKVTDAFDRHIQRVWDYMIESWENGFRYELNEEIFHKDHIPSYRSMVSLEDYVMTRSYYYNPGLMHSLYFKDLKTEEVRTVAEWRADKRLDIPYLLSLRQVFWNHYEGVWEQ